MLSNFNVVTARFSSSRAFFDRAASHLKAKTPSGSGLRAVSHLKAKAMPSGGPCVGEGVGDAELVILPILRFGADASKFGFPSEAPLGHCSIPDHRSLELDAERSFWGPLATTVTD